MVWSYHHPFKLLLVSLFWVTVVFQSVSCACISYQLRYYVSGAVCDNLYSSEYYIYVYIYTCTYNIYMLYLYISMSYIYIYIYILVIYIYIYQINSNYVFRLRRGIINHRRKGHSHRQVTARTIVTPC